MEDQNQFPGNSGGIYCCEIDIGAGSSPSTSVFTANYDSTNAPFSHLSSGVRIMGTFVAALTTDSVLPQPENNKKIIIPFRSGKLN
jgi:hypothetical protein